MHGGRKEGKKKKKKRELEAEPFGQAGRRDHILIPNKQLTAKIHCLEGGPFKLYERCFLAPCE